ncbi:hypothetical protein B0T26DRAFT_876873 [Lasiosphaeria miniovina]|uniref:Uncharacterized protein n=1 Tax=Lasiosphaeria miniovina TaxID=1954250 RepID=A0AA40DKE3_9PEZI|nr:uncharacterized protein B0T26DRAFT_876873 [Lasiosphaeria miniovina]KAK0704047.1 hypothetical protein B0T26DRAFT_876873 [Lasiosphaeria miniovina]
MSTIYRNVSTIYRNALLTIAVVDNVSADEVLQQPLIPVNLDLREQENRTYLCASRKSDYRAQGDLDTRGWTLQERSLCRRVPGDWTQDEDEDEDEDEGEGWDWVDDFAATKCLLMFQSERPTGSGTQYCMVLRPTGRGANEYVRLGLCEFKWKSGASLEPLHVCLESKETCPDLTAHRGDCMGDYETVLIV